MSFIFSGVLRYLLLALVLTFSATARSSQVVPLTLERVLHMMMEYRSLGAIAVGTVRQHKVEDTGMCPSDSSVYYYHIEISQVLIGKLQAKSLDVDFFPVCGSPDYSIYDLASRIEYQLQIGERYIFLLGSIEEEQGGLPGRAVLVRAEMEDRRDALLEAWRDVEHEYEQRQLLNCYRLSPLIPEREGL
ncbi:MAG: hypothetical protein LBE22_06010 [Azoarcus sp.]|nr:hypothetical protein [Azoarcus sp.]